MEQGEEAYFVGLVIVLWVVFEHFRLLDVVEVPHQLVDAKVFPPLLAINKPATSRSTTPVPTTFLSGH